MDRHMEIRCPNCGSLAQRLLSDGLPTGFKCPAQQVTQTKCSVCDYFMAMCSQNGRVLEAYAPGIRRDFFTATTTKPEPETAIALLPVSSVMTLVQGKLRTGQTAPIVENFSIVPAHKK